MFEIPNMALISEVEKLIPKLMIKGKIKKRQNKTPIINNADELNTIDFINFRSFSYKAGTTNCQICRAI